MSLTVQTITDIFYKTEDKKHINCKVKFAEFNEVLPFTANAIDPEEHGISIYNDIISGKYGPIGDYVPSPAPTTEQLWMMVRDQRDAILKQSDILVLPDRWASYTTEKQTAVSTYRQALRDFPENNGAPNTDPTGIKFPVPPDPSFDFIGPRPE